MEVEASTGSSMEVASTELASMEETRCLCIMKTPRKFTMKIASVDASMKTGSTEAYVEASTEATSMEAFMEASVELP